jgi:hypothetical protein
MTFRKSAHGAPAPAGAPCVHPCDPSAAYRFARVGIAKSS